MRAFSAYGLSKALSWQTVRFFAQEAGITPRKFVIPNPFGPYEEMRFTSYLARTWLAGECPSVNTPSYVRDNVPVSLLALAYAAFVESGRIAEAPAKFNPSFRPESQRAFAQRVAREMERRWGRPCAITFAADEVLTEPRVRTNTDPLDAEFPGWAEAAFWDELAEYYRRSFSRPAA